MDIYIIYRVKNLINGKSYIGFTSKTLEHRKRHHYYHSKYMFGKALQRYPREYWQWEILFQNYDLDYVLNILEPYYIAKYDTLAPNGYNICKGGRARFGPHSQETKNKISTALKGKERPEEIQAKLRILNKGRKLGPCSEITKQKISKAKKGTTKLTESQIKNLTNINSRTYLITFPNGTVEKVHNLSAFIREYNLTNQLRKVVSGTISQFRGFKAIRII